VGADKVARTAQQTVASSLVTKTSPPADRALGNDDGQTLVTRPMRPRSATEIVTEAPQRLGRYTLLKRLGVGGMAEVFLAEQEGAAGFKKSCVVKRMLPHLAAQQRFVDMFLREAHLAATLHHTNIVQIWDLGEVDGTYFIAMDHIDGMPMNLLARTAWRASRPIPIELVCCVLADAAEGLAAAHERIDGDGRPSPIIHRDISPDNLMIDRDGVTKILDFGIARSDGSERTATGELKGKVPFMSPEQLRGTKIDERVDVYALGITAYWLLTGKRPFSGPSDLVVMQSILADPPRDLRTINARIPDGLNALVLRMLEKDRDRRVGTAREIASALEYVLPVRRTIVAPFVRSILDLPLVTSSDDPPSARSGFLPATPHTDTLKAGWQRLLALEQAIEPRDKTQAPLAAGDEVATATLLAHRPATAGVVVADAPPRHRAWRAVFAAAGVVMVAMIVAVVLWPRPTAPPAPPALLPAVAVLAAPGIEAAAVETPPAPAAPLAPAPTPAVEEAPTAPEAASTRSRSVAPAKRTVVVSAPAGVQWLLDRKVIGSGSRALQIPVGARELVAVDKRRGARTTIPLTAASSTIDYATLPRGKLQPRAKPFADVFLGEEGLGATPFPAVDVVAGTYRVRFVYKTKETTRTVDVGAGAIARPAVDFADVP
jgi:serine/threonine-protein kinase